MNINAVDNPGVQISAKVPQDEANHEFKEILKNYPHNFISSNEEKTSVIDRISPQQDAISGSNDNYQKSKGFDENDDKKKRAVEFIANMGFQEQHVENALIQTDYNIQNAVNILSGKNEKKPKKRKRGKGFTKRSQPSQKNSSTSISSFYSESSTSSSESETDSNEEEDTKGTWTDSNDLLLYEKYRKHGRNWRKISLYFPPLSSKQVKRHWNRSLKKRIADIEWTEKEDKLLIAVHEVLGNDWISISKHFPGRSPESILKRWVKECKTREKNASSSSEEEERKEKTENVPEVKDQNTISVEEPKLAMNAEFDHPPPVNAQTTFEPKIEVNEPKEVPKKKKKMSESDGEFVYMTDDGEEKKDKTLTRWTESDDAKLIEIYQKHGTKWSYVKNAFPKRSLAAIKQHLRILETRGLTNPLPNTLSGDSSMTFEQETPPKKSEVEHLVNEEKERKRQWTDEEDKLLFAKFKELNGNWAKISKFFPTRTPNALKAHVYIGMRERGEESKMLKIRKPWSDEENALLTGFVTEGKSWDYICSQFANRTPSAVKIHYNLLKSQSGKPKSEADGEEKPKKGKTEQKRRRKRSKKGENSKKLSDDEETGRFFFRSSKMNDKGEYFEGVGSAKGKSGAAESESASSDEVLISDSSSELSASEASVLYSESRLIDGYYWDDKHDDELVFAVEKFGKDWNEIKEYFAPASIESIRRRYKILKKALDE